MSQRLQLQTRLKTFFYVKIDCLTCGLGRPIIEDKERKINVKLSLPFAARIR